MFKQFSESDEIDVGVSPGPSELESLPSELESIPSELDMPQVLVFLMYLSNGGDNVRTTNSFSIQNISVFTPSVE